MSEKNSLLQRLTVLEILVCDSAWSSMEARVWLERHTYVTNTSYSMILPLLVWRGPLLVGVSFIILRSIH
jgi:hypothetical protein